MKTTERLRFFDIGYSDDANEVEQLTKELSESLEGILILANSLGLDIEAKHILPEPSAVDKLASLFLDKCVFNLEVSDMIHDTYGDKPRFCFNLSQMLVIAHVFASFLKHPMGKNIPAKRKGMIISQRKLAMDYITEFVSPFLVENSKPISDMVSEDFKVKCLALSKLIKLANPTPSHFAKVHKYTESVVNALVSNYSDISERLKIYREIDEALTQCKASRNEWQQYETLCIKALRFLFVPPFKRVLAQVRSGDKHERRDAILPNNHYQGFWNQLRQEFDCRHVVCEFKNGDTINKDSLVVSQT